MLVLVLRPRRCQDPRSGIDKADSHFPFQGFAQVDGSKPILRVLGLGMIFLFCYLL